MPRPHLRSAAWLFFGLLAGCGRETATVSGSVKYDNQDLAGGFVTFYPQGEGVSRGGPVVEGAYKVEDLTPGSYRVLVSTPAQYVEDAKEKSGVKRLTQPNVPAKAPGNQRTVQVQPGPQTVDLHVKKPG